VPSSSKVGTSIEMPWLASPPGTPARANSSAMIRDLRMSGSAPNPPYSRGMVRAV